MASYRLILSSYLIVALVYSCCFISILVSSLWSIHSVFILFEFLGLIEDALTDISEPIQQF